MGIHVEYQRMPFERSGYMSECVKHHKTGDIVVLELCFEEITLDQHDRVKKEMEAMVLAGETDFIVDLSRIGFLSSLVIAILVSFSKKVRENNGRMKLSGLSDEGRGILKLTQLNRILEIYDTERDALESFKDFS